MLHWGKIDKFGLEPKFLGDVIELLEPSPYDWYASEAYRPIERSNKLYDEYINGIVVGRTANGVIIRGKKGPTAAPGGKSAHNFGLGIDVMLDGDTVKPGCQPTWNVKLSGWTWLKLAVFKHPRLHSLWKIGDWPHIERLNWRDYVAWKRVYEDNVAALGNPSNYVGLGIPT